MASCTAAVTVTATVPAAARPGPPYSHGIERQDIIIAILIAVLFSGTISFFQV